MTRLRALLQLIGDYATLAAIYLHLTTWPDPQEKKP